MSIDIENLNRIVSGVWDKRLALVDLKHKFPTLGAKEDEELLHNKERIPKRIKTDSAFPGKLPSLKIRTNGDASPQTPAEVTISPRQRTITIQSQIERVMSRLKDRDHHWDDQIDVSSTRILFSNMIHAQYCIRGTHKDSSVEGDIGFQSGLHDLHGTLKDNSVEGDIGFLPRFSLLHGARNDSSFQQRDNLLINL
ncbi:hypothetical protein FIBSPDRAFT_952694 [Athelia psychrophila]|uniref:Uncharacterized protein n=1 Tax=Athelia psychrophila TaxID=1759441 RepID=A0A166L4U0_9AGAM|nr:hypothetical protein FIBSPDRAFT_952694 [Fibularhizoctonia sp. CBS 109695]